MSEKIIEANEIDFSYDGYQVVRREFFSHLREPAVSIKNDCITFNMACIKRMQNVVYIQILINPENKKMVVRPCDEDDKDAINWSSVKGENRKSRSINCKLFAAKLYDLLNWDSNCRYKILGTPIMYEEEALLVFDLLETEVYLTRAAQVGDVIPDYRKAYYPDQWKDSFGLPVAEHKNSLKIDILDGYAVFAYNDIYSRISQKVAVGGGVVPDEQLFRE